MSTLTSECTFDVVTVGGLQVVMPKRVEGIVVGSPDKLVALVDPVFLVVVQDELSVCYVFGHR
jgi:hypothetical protein